MTRCLSFFAALLLTVGVSTPSSAQARTVPSSAVPDPASSFAVSEETVSSLEGPWFFRLGDDPSWAAPGLDLGDWSTLEVPGTWKSLGVGDARWGWYRTRVRLEGHPEGGWGIALGRVFSAFELYADGELIASAGSFPPDAEMEYDLLRVWPLPVEGPGEVDLALRVYAHPADPGGGGVTRGPVEIGSYPRLLVRYSRWDLSRILLAAIFACAGLYHLYLFAWRRQLRTYLWFGLFSLVFSGYSVMISQWRVVLSDDYALLKRWEFIAAILLVHMSQRFLLLLIEDRTNRWAEAYLAVHLVAAAACLVTPELHHHIRILLWWLPWALLGIVWVSFIVLRAWIRGHPEGRTVGLGFVVMVASFVHDLFLAQGWITGPFLVTYGFGAFAGAMALSLADRFNRVHRELDVLSRDLEGRVEERTLEIEEARRAAEEANRAKGRFLAHMSHEIRTPMNGVLGVMDLLAGTRLSAGQKRYLDMIRSSAEMLLRIINDVLDLSRIEAGHLEHEAAAFDLHRLCRDVAGLSRLEADEKGLETRLEIESGVPEWVVGDAPRLRQVLVNLLTNAVKFTERGSVELKVSVLKLEPWLRFSVADTGIGMTEGTLEKLFRPFQQGDSSTQRRFGGTGLGLVIARRVVENSGGLIRVESKTGQGSVFHVDLPLEATEKVSARASSEQEGLIPEGVRGARVLLVEDDGINQLVAQTHLESFGVEVVLAENGEEALEALAEQSFDLVLMDCQLPGVDGYEATRRWRARESTGAGRTPIVALTAHAVEGERERCLAAGMDDYLTKPVRVDDLGRTLGTWIKREDRLVVEIARV